MAMDQFEAAYLLCDLEIALIPRPRHFEEPFYSTEIYELEDYPALDVAETFSTLPEMTVTSLGGMADEEGWFRWRWRWERADRLIELNFSAFEMESPGRPILWGGSELTTLCTFADLVRLWLAVQQRLPASWLHDDDCRVYTPHSFLETYALPRLRPALAHPDLAVRERAAAALAEYRGLGYRMSWRPIRRERTARVAGRDRRRSW